MGTKNTGRNADHTFVVLRGRMATHDPVEKERARAALDEYRRKLKVREAEALLKEERRRVLAAAGLDPDLAEDST